MPDIEELRARHELLGELTRGTLAGFVIEYFLRRPSWLTRVHHAMSIITLGAVVAVAIARDLSVLRCLRDFGAALVALFLFVLPLHELLHAFAYRLVGARDVRWDYSLRLAAAWVVAHHFVAATRAFVFVALVPFVVINPLLIGAAIAFPSLTVFFLFLLLWHLHGSSGDWALLNFVWLHRERGFWTFDDAVSGTSYFFGRAR
ncbi:MAG TPA: DUF3267 domain-containing protein [Thermoanaerobaculia bacterium]|nr:DUF3267 domain-containing protein [Thermoanaerobaculia bacterium]